MTIVSSKEFIAHQKKYFDLALNEHICIKRGRNMFHLTYSPLLDDESEEEDVELLTLAKERIGGEFVSAEEFIRYVRK